MSEYESSDETIDMGHVYSSSVSQQRQLFPEANTWNNHFVRTKMGSNDKILMEPDRVNAKSWFETLVFCCVDFRRRSCNNKKYSKFTASARWHLKFQRYKSATLHKKSPDLYTLSFHIYLSLSHKRRNWRRTIQLAVFVQIRHVEQTY